MNDTWIDVDKAGLAQILEERGKSFALLELLQNAWDTDATRVEVTLEKFPGEPWAELIVKDNDPNGFYDLSHAYTMFAPSIKKDDPTKRGRFNLGEKLVLSMCKWAEVRSTKGSVQFNKDGTRTSGRAGKTDEGSVFEAVIKMTKSEYQDCCTKMLGLLPPKEVNTIFNGCLLLSRKPKLVFEATLPTVTMDADGNLTKKTKRRCEVEVYEPVGGEEATLYEMGIPVVESDSRFHINVQQKVPLNVDRDNVTPAYLKKVRVEVLNRVHEMLTDDEAGDTWVTDALGHQDVETDAVVLLGEIGGSMEEEAAEFIGEHMSKPVVSLIVGRYAPEGERMGHAGAIIQGGRGTAVGKIAALERAGARIVKGPREIPIVLKELL